MLTAVSSVLGEQDLDVSTCELNPLANGVWSETENLSHRSWAKLVDLLGYRNETDIKHDFFPTVGVIAIPWSI
jgi:hypothetical protein